MFRLSVLIAMFITGLITAQTNYEKGMEKALELMQSNKLDAAENIFERIANAESDEWLAHYYIAQINSLKSWNVKNEALLKAQLDKAEKHINEAKQVSENNVEILVLQAHILTNWVAYDGATYGMKYAASVSELYNRAYELAPENPRVVYNKAEWAMGSAKYFGQDTKPFCKDIEKSLELFANFKPESKFHPNWGKQRAEQVLASCK
ncbi:hypothetical protein D7030_10000 [Flavobacteriaceae bacterium AU392]|nr:hypothetical protein D1817_06810 [Flavobacteriaceae bacterium]RKM83618.1 hypothetical protein D7030_10000 [Flavobacteriaceae bacterium AU392]